MMRSLILRGPLGCAFLGLVTSASAQVVSPMEQEIAGFSTMATAQFIVSNPYPHAQVSEFFIVSDTGAPIKGARIAPRMKTLASGARTTLTVSVPMVQNGIRKAYVCHAITPRTPGQVTSGTQYRGEVCAKLIATSLSAS